MPTKLRPVAFSSSSGETDYVFDMPDTTRKGHVSFKAYGVELYDAANSSTGREPREPGVYCDNPEKEKYTVIIDDPFLLLESELRRGVAELNTEFDRDFELAPDDPWV